MNLEHFNKMSSGLFSHLQNYPPSAGIFMDHHRQPDVSSFPQDAARRYRPTSNVELKPPRGPIRTSNHHSSPCNLNRDVQDSHCRPSPDPGLREAALPNTAVSAAAAAAAAAAVTAAPPPPQHQQAQAQNQQQQQQQQQQQPPSSRPNHNGASTPRANHGPSTSRANHVTGPGGQSEPRKSKTKRVMDPGDGRYFPCPRCSKIFVSQRNLDSHLKTHTNLRPLKCLDCGKCFTLRNTLICHMRVHTKERPYTCSICFKSFTQASSLKAHVICVHTKQYPHQCTQCGRGFISPSQRREHDVRFHSKKQQQPPMN